MGLISTNYHDLVTHTHSDVQDALVTGSRVSMKEAFLESRLVSTIYLVIAVGRSFFLAFGELNCRNWPEKDWELVGTQLKMTFVALALILPTAVAPKRFFLWLIPEDSPLLEDKAFSNLKENYTQLYTKSVELKRERDRAVEHYHRLEELVESPIDNKRLMKQSMQMLTEIKRLKEELSKKNASPRMSQHLEGLRETIRLGVKVIGKEGKEWLLVQYGETHTDSSEIFLRHPKDWERFIKRMKQETDYCQRLIREATELPEERVGAVTIGRGSSPRRTPVSEIRFDEEDSIEQLGQLARGVPLSTLDSMC